MTTTPLPPTIQREAEKAADEFSSDSSTGDFEEGVQWLYNYLLSITPESQPRKFLIRPAVLDWLQWAEFPEKLGSIDGPQVTLTLIQEYRDEVSNQTAQIAALKARIEELEGKGSELPKFIKLDQTTEQLARETAYQDIIKQLQRGYKATYDSIENKIRETDQYCFNLLAHFDTLKAENQRLREALKFYANTVYYQSKEKPSVIDNDCGFLASQVLSGTEGEKG